MPFPTTRTYVGVAKESVKNTAVAPTASIPVTGVTPHDEIVSIDDTGLRGSMVGLYDANPGPVWSTLGLSGQVYPDSLPWYLASLLPDVTESGAGPFLHTFAVLNTGTGQPAKGYTFAVYDGLGATSGARYFPGAVGHFFI